MAQPSLNSSEISFLYTKDSGPYCLLVLFDRLCPNGTGLVAGMGAVKGSSVHNGADWENVRQLQLMPRIYDYASSQGMYSLQGAAVSV